MTYTGHTCTGYKHKSIFKLRRWFNTWQVVHLSEFPNWVENKYDSVIAHRCEYTISFWPSWWAFSMPNDILENAPRCSVCKTIVPDGVFGVWQLLNMDKEK